MQDVEWLDRSPVPGILSGLRASCPAFRPELPLARSGKSLVIGGRFEGRRAVAKLLVDAPPEWSETLRQEERFSNLAAKAVTPIRAPALLFSNVDRGVLILELVDGWPLAVERYPSQPVDASGFDLLAGALPGLH